MTEESMANLLSAEEIEHYHREGWVVPEFRLPDEQIDRLRAALDAVIAENPETRPERLVSIHIRADGGEGVRGHDEFMSLAQDDRLVEAVSELMGPDVILWGCQSFCKPGGDGMEVPWHQDGHYWPIRPLATCTAWVAIDASRKENGCLRVIPRSHRDQQLVEHQKEDREDVTLNQRVVDGVFHESAAVDIELEPGQVSFHDVYLVHGSNANRSTKRRAGVAIRYMPGTSLFDRGMIETGNQAGYVINFAERPIWLLRGEDKTGANDFEVGHA